MVAIWWGFRGGVEVLVVGEDMREKVGDAWAEGGS
jgi:hypothetical protein